MNYCPTYIIYILSPSKARKDIFTIVQWSSYESFWYMLITFRAQDILELYISWCTWLIKSFMWFYSPSVKTLESRFNPFHAARTFLVVSILNFINISYMYFGPTILAPQSIYIDHISPIFWFFPNLPLKSNFQWNFTRVNKRYIISNQQYVFYIMY